MNVHSFIQLLHKIDDFNSKLRLNEDKEITNELKILYVKRFSSFTNALFALIPNMKKNDYSIISIGIILRTCMSDLITFYYLFYLIRTKPNDYKSDINRFMADNLRFLLKDISNIENSKERLRYVSLMKEKWSEYFEKDKNEIIKPLKVSISDMALELMKENKAIYLEAYESYSYLSKFEHIGKLTFELQDYHERDMDTSMKKVVVTYGLYLDSYVSILNSFCLSTQLKSELNEIVESAKKL